MTLRSKSKIADSSVVPATTAQPLKGRAARHRRAFGAVTLIAALLVISLMSLGWIDPRADAISKANSLLREGSYEDALKLYENVMVNYPGDLVGRLNSAIALYAADRYEDSSIRFNEVLAALSDPETELSDEAGQLVETVSHYGLGCAQFRLGSALESLSGTSASDQGALVAAIEHYKRALSSFRATLRLDPEDEDARHNYRLTYTRLKELEQLLGDDSDLQDSDQSQSSQNHESNAEGQANEDESSDQASEHEDSDQGERDEEGQQLPLDTSSQGSMTAEEALRLLETMDSGDQYGVLVQQQGAESSGDYPDW